MDQTLLQQAKEKRILKIRKYFGKEIYDTSVMYSTTEVPIPQSLLAAIVINESDGRKQAVRFEQAVFDKIKSVPNITGLDALMFASSHGACQIMGYHSKEAKYLGKAQYGTLSKTIADFYSHPTESCAVFLLSNCSLYLKLKNYTSVLSIYNGGSPQAYTKLPITAEYVKHGLENMTLYEHSLKNIPKLDEYLKTNKITL